VWINWKRQAYYIIMFSITTRHESKRITMTIFRKSIGKYIKYNVSYIHNNIMYTNGYTIKTNIWRSCINIIIIKSWKHATYGIIEQNSNGEINIRKLAEIAYYIWTMDVYFYCKRNHEFHKSTVTNGPCARKATSSPERNMHHVHLNILLATTWCVDISDDIEP